MRWPPAARRSALDQGTDLRRAHPGDQVMGSAMVVGSVSLPRRRFRGLTARPYSRKGPARARSGTRGGDGGPCGCTAGPSEATPRRRGRDTAAGSRAEKAGRRVVQNRAMSRRRPWQVYFQEERNDKWRSRSFYDEVAAVEWAK